MLIIRVKTRESQLSFHDDSHRYVTKRLKISAVLISLASLFVHPCIHFSISAHRMIWCTTFRGSADETTAASNVPVLPTAPVLPNSAASVSADQAVQASGQPSVGMGVDEDGDRSQAGAQGPAPTDGSEAAGKGKESIDGGEREPEGNDHAEAKSTMLDEKKEAKVIEADVLSVKVNTMSYHRRCHDMESMLPMGSGGSFGTNQGVYRRWTFRSAPAST